MKFNTKIEQLMKESLLEGQADYGDVMDSLKKLENAVTEFSHIYPADRGTHIHASYKAEVERMIGRIKEWTNKQTAFVKQKNSGINPDVEQESPTKS